MPLAELTAGVVLSSVPWRSVRAHRGQRHLSGWYWSATTGAHVVYESRLELARLLLADFDPDVVGIAAQPFLLADADRRHVPDFLLESGGWVGGDRQRQAGRSARRRACRRGVGVGGAVFAGRGWEHEVWSGTDAQLLANVRFLAGYRREGLVSPGGRRGDVDGWDSGDDRIGGRGAQGRGGARAAADAAGSVVVGSAAGGSAAALKERFGTGGAVVSVACLTIGSRVTYDGEVCTVLALAGDRVTVQQQRSGRALSVRIASLLAAPGSGMIDLVISRPVAAAGPASGESHGG